ncbi:unnamed protein product [Urochloa humidicola]
MTRAAAVVMAILAATAALAVPARAQQCGAQAGSPLCPGCACCSQYGWCGTTSTYCGAGCQGQCGCGGVASIISLAMFEQMLLHRNDVGCPARGFYTYDAFIAAVNAFPSFGTTGTLETPEARDRRVPGADLARDHRRVGCGARWTLLMGLLLQTRDRSHL